MRFKNSLLHKLICIIYLLIYLNNNVTVAFYICRHISYCFLDNNNRSRAVLTASRTPGKAMHLGPYLTTHRNKTVNVYKIKHIDIVLVFPAKSVFKPQKNIQYTTCIDKHGAPMPVVPGKMPSVPMRSDGTEYTPLLHLSNVNVKDLQTTLDAM